MNGKTGEKTSAITSPNAGSPKAESPKAESRKPEGRKSEGRKSETLGPTLNYLYHTYHTYHIPTPRKVNADPYKGKKRKKGPNVVNLSKSKTSMKTFFKKNQQTSTQRW